MSTLDDAEEFLRQRLPELTGPGRLHQGKEPSTVVDPAVTVYDWMAGSGDYVMEKVGPNTEPQRFRAVARSKDFRAARDLIGRVRAASNTYGGVFNGNRYLRTEPITSVFPTDPPDANDRVSLGFVFEMKAAY